MTIDDDSAKEINEQFKIRLFSPKRATLSTSLAVVTIVDDDEDPNEPPVIDLSVSPDTGAAPLDVVASVRVVDPEGQAVEYTVDFGDGTPAIGSSDPTVNLEHRYNGVGNHLVVVNADDGVNQQQATLLVTSVLGEPLVAAAGDDRRTTVGQEIRFDGVASRPLSLIEEFEWDFGDGTVAQGRSVAHAYESAGEYEVTLSTSIGAEVSVDTALITVEPVPLADGLSVTVTAGGSLLAGAEVFTVLPSGEVLTRVTDSAGIATIDGLEDGETTVYVWANGFQPTTALAEVIDGAGSVEVAVVSGEAGAATLDSRRLTLQEIVDLGIDVSDPDNLNTYEARINLYFEPDSGEVVEEEVTLVVSPDGVRCIVNCAGFGGGSGGSGGPGGGGSGGSCDATGPESPCFILGGKTATPSVDYVDGQPVIQWLILPVRASFLKEFFQVEMLVQNLTGGFTFAQGAAELNLPRGLSLAPTGTPQQLTQGIGRIDAGNVGRASWYVRGDEEGEYGLSASYVGVVEPIGRPVRFDAATRSPLKVWVALRFR